MALQFIDGFDHYGTGAGSLTAMANGVYANVGQTGPSNTQVRTGTYGLKMAAVSNDFYRRVFSGSVATAGLGYAHWCGSLPVNNATYILAAFRDSGNLDQCAIVLQSTGAIAAYRGNGAINGSYSALLGTSSPVIVTSSWQHIECRVTIDDTVGTVEVRVDGVTVLSLTGKDTKATATAGTAQVMWGRGSDSIGTPVVTEYIDDLFAWDTTGGANNDFIGDRRVRTIFPDGNAATQEWAVTGAASAYQAINEAAPDGDTSYISASTSPTTSEFTLQDAPVSVGAISGAQTYVYAKKTDAGTATMQVSMLSGVSVSAGADRPVTTAYTYWMDMHPVDPATGAPWTRDGLNAATLRVRRTS